MKTPKLADKLVTGLLRLGWVEQNATVRYRRFGHDGSRSAVFVGKAGALRISSTGRVSDTFMASATFRGAVLYAWEHPDPPSPSSEKKG